MKLRKFGLTDLSISEVGFGSWAIGGQSFGKVLETEALNALARAEELGCNFIDTAEVYGNAEQLIGKFLKHRRHKWLVASKYSGQKEGIRKTLEQQLSVLGIDTMDLYQIHWMPSKNEEHLLETLIKLKKEGKTRYIGVSVYSDNDMRRGLCNSYLDGFQVKLSLLSPNPFIQFRTQITSSGKGVIARSSLEDGFLTGKYHINSQFSDPNDRRAQLTKKEIQDLLNKIEAFNHIHNDSDDLFLLATRYALSFNEISTLLISTKNFQQATFNFEVVPRHTLSKEMLDKIFSIQHTLGLYDKPTILKSMILRILRSLNR